MLETCYSFNLCCENAADDPHVDLIRVEVGQSSKMPRWSLVEESARHIGVPVSWSRLPGCMYLRSQLPPDSPASHPSFVELLRCECTRSKFKCRHSCAKSGEGSRAGDSPHGIILRSDTTCAHGRQSCATWMTRSQVNRCTIKVPHQGV